MVAFDGVDLARRPRLGAPNGIAHCDREFSPLLGDTVLAQVAAPLLARRMSLKEAEMGAGRLLAHAGADDCLQRTPSELDHAETLRVALARALANRPRLLLVDEPTTGVPVAEVVPLLELLRGLADSERVAVLMTVGHASELAGADRALLLDAGELRGETAPRPTATIVPLPARRRRAPA